MYWGFNINDSRHRPVVTAKGIYLTYIGMNNNKMDMGFDWDGVPVTFHPCA